MEFFEKSLKSLFDLIWVIWEKVVFSQLFCVLLEIRYEKNDDFWRFFETLQNFASFLKTNFFKFFSKKKSVHSPHLSWKISVFWNSQLKSFWHFLKKSRFFNFFIPVGKPWKRTTKKSNFWCFSYQSKIYIRYNIGDLMRSCFSMNVLYYWKIGLDQYQILWNYEMSQKPLSQ